jgi:photosystem II stability/assembly factor-like uncharacterized protein
VKISWITTAIVLGAVSLTTTGAVVRDPSSASVTVPQKTINASLLTYPPKSVLPELPFGTLLSLSRTSGFSFANASTGYAIGSKNLFTYVLKTTDGGRIWRTVGPAFTTGGAEATAGIGAVNAVSASVAVVYGAQATTPVIAVTEDSGQRWWVADLGDVLLTEATKGSEIWALVSGPAPGIGPVRPPTWLYESSNGGRTWHFRSTVLNMGGYSADLSWVSKNIAFALVGGVLDAMPWWTIVETTDGGTHWSRLGDPCDMRFDDASVNFVERLQAASASSLWLLCGSQPGIGSQVKLVERSSDGGRSWVRTVAVGPGPDFVRGFPYMDYLEGIGSLNYLFVTSPTDAALLLAGSLPDPVLRTTDGGIRWAGSLPTRIADQFPQMIWVGPDFVYVKTQNALWFSRGWTRWILIYGSLKPY